MVLRDFFGVANPFTDSVLGESFLLNQLSHTSRTTIFEETGNWILPCGSAITIVGCFTEVQILQLPRDSSSLPVALLSMTALLYVFEQIAVRCVLTVAQPLEMFHDFWGRQVYVDGGVSVCSTALREAVESAVCNSKSGIVKMPPKENRDDRNAKRPANTGNVRAGRCCVRGMIALTLSCRKKGDYLGSRASHSPCPALRRILAAEVGTLARLAHRRTAISFPRRFR